jgi:putative transposase
LDAVESGDQPRPQRRPHGQAEQLQFHDDRDILDLYVVIDIFSRYVPAWTVMPTESGEVAKDMIQRALIAQGVGRDQLTIHADRGGAMTSGSVAELLAFLGVDRSHSRPHISNDNPFSESQFKTMKYCPAFPERLGSIHDARTFCEAFFTHYNHQHYHSGIAYHTPAGVHYGTATQVRAQRAATLQAAYAANPLRFGHRKPAPPKLPTIAWINQPTPQPTLRLTRFSGQVG